MACNVSYIRRDFNGHPQLIGRLEQINTEVWNRLKDSNLFREYGNTLLFSKVKTKQYDKQVALIRQINSDYNAPKSIIKKRPTVSGYNDKVVVSLHPIAKQVWYELDAANRVREQEQLGITYTGESDTDLLASNGDSFRELTPEQEANPFAVFVINNSPDGVAVTTRAADRGEGDRIGLPGGKVDPGEDPKNAAIREATEEGWQIDPNSELTIVASRMVDGNPVVWYSVNNAIPLDDYKEKHRGITPKRTSIEEISNSGYGNDFISKLLGPEEKPVQGSDPDIEEKYFSKGKVTSIKQVLTKIANSDHPLAPLAKQLQKYNPTGKIRLVDTDMLDVKTDIEGLKPVGVYRPSKGDILIAKDGRFKGKGGSEPTILHEILHAISFKKIRGSNQMAKDWEKLFNEVKKHEDKFTDKYPLSNADELFTAVFTNAKFIDELKTIEPSEGVDKYPNLWDKILDFFHKLFNIKEKDSNLFDQVFSLATNLLENETSGFSSDEIEIMNSGISSVPEDLFLASAGQSIAEEEQGTKPSSPVQVTERKPEEVMQDILTKQSELEKKDVKAKDEEGNEITEQRYFKNGKQISKRVSDLVKALYERMFRNSDLNKPEWVQALDDLHREKGTAGHQDFEHAITLMIDPETKQVVSQKQYEQNLENDDYSPSIDDKEAYDIIRNNLWERVNSFKKGTKFLSEVMVYNDTRSTKNSDIGGTLDLVVLEPDEGNTKVHVFDWKFIKLNTEKYSDVPWYKMKAWNLQMNTYLNILKENYGISDEQLGKTRMIPILTTYDSVYNNVTGETKSTLSSIEIGAVDPMAEGEYKEALLPVPVRTETTGDKNIDKLLQSLNALYKKMGDKPVPEEFKGEKADKMNSLFSAIRQLQLRNNIAPAIRQVQSILTDAEKIIADYNDNFSVERDVPNAEMSAFLNRIIDVEEALSIFSGIQNSIGKIYNNLKNSDDPQDQELFSDINTASINAETVRNDLDKTMKEFVDNFIGGKYGFKQLLDAETVVKAIPKHFNSTSTIQNAPIQVLFKIAEEVRNNADFQADDQSDKVEKISKLYKPWAKKKGLTKREYFNPIKKKDKNELIDQYEKEFYDSLKKKIAKGDTKWMKANLDMEALRAGVEEALNKELEKIENSHKYYIQEGQLDESSAKEADRRKAKDYYSIKNPNAGMWKDKKLLQQFPLDKWETKEYKELQKPENLPAKMLYDYIRERNEYFASIGYISKWEARKFLPFVRSGLIERMMTGNRLHLARDFYESISIDGGTEGYGYIDPITHRVVNRIPKYYTNELPNSEVSQDIFANMVLLNHSAIRYQYLSEVEGMVVSLRKINEAKGHLVWDKNTKDFKTEGGNEKNAALFNSMMEALIYGRKYVDASSFDAAMGSPVSLIRTCRNINDKLEKWWGIRPLPDGDPDEDREVSLARSVDAITNYFYLLHLNSLNVVSPLSNLVGGGIQTAINAGGKFTSADFGREMIALTPGFVTARPEYKKKIAALKYVMPYTENVQREVRAKDVSYNNLNPTSMQHYVGGLMRRSDRHVQAATAIALLDNSIVKDGRVFNVNDYVHNQKWYRDRFNNNSPIQVREAEKRAKKEIKELIDKYGFWKSVKIDENDKLLIPGVERNSKDIHEVRTTSMAIAQKSLGNMSESQKRLMDLSLVTKNMMVFKNWIPGVLEARTGKLKYNSATDAYEWGRWITFWKFGASNLFKALRGVIEGFRVTQGGIERMREMYEKQREIFRKEYGRDMDMDFDQFASLTMNNLRAQLKDFIFIASLMSLYLLTKAVLPDDDEDPSVRSYHNFVLRTLDKLQDEATFYYNIHEFQQLVVGSVFPSFSVFEDGFKVLSEFSEQMYGVIIQNDEMVDSAKPLKYFMRTFPFAKQITNYLPLFASDAAKDWGVRINSVHNIE